MIDMQHFDTLNYVETLITAGIPDVQAKALARAQQTVISECLETTFPSKLATKEDLSKLDIKLEAKITKIQADIVELKADNLLFKWMFGFLLSGMGMLLSGVITLVLKII